MIINTVIMLQYSNFINIFISAAALGSRPLLFVACPSRFRNKKFNIYDKVHILITIIEIISNKLNKKVKKCVEREEDTVLNQILCQH